MGMFDKTQQQPVANRKAKSDGYYRRLEFLALLLIIVFLFVFKIVAFMNLD